MKKRNLVELVLLLFVLVLNLSLFANDKKKSEKLVKINAIVEKDGELIRFDTTLKAEHDRIIEVHHLLKQRFPELDSTAYKFARMDVENALHEIKVFAEAKRAHAYEFNVGDKKGKVVLHLSDIDSLEPYNKMIEEIIISTDLDDAIILKDSILGKLRLSVHHDHFDSVFKTHRIELLHKLKDEHQAYTYIVKDGEETIDVLDIHKSGDFHFGLVLNNDLSKKDISLLKKIGVKASKESLDVKKLYIYTDNEEYFNLKFKLKTKGKAVIKVLDDEGETILEDKVDYFPGTYDKELDIKTDVGGMYFIVIEQNGKNYVSKFKID